MPDEYTKGLRQWQLNGNVKAGTQAVVFDLPRLYEWRSTRVYNRRPLDLEEGETVRISSCDKNHVCVKNRIVPFYCLMLQNEDSI